MNVGQQRNPLTGAMDFLTESTHLKLLYLEYNDEVTLHREKNPLSLDELNASEEWVRALIKTIETYPQLESYVEKAHHLSKDFNNKITKLAYEACSGYSISLQIYAEQHKESFSEEEYTALQHAIDVLGRGLDY